MTNSKKMNPQKLKDTLLKYALYIILLLLLVVIVAIKPNFLSVGNLISILKQASTKGILAYGVAGIIILAGTDLSVGRVLGLCAAVAASLLQSVTFASRYYPSITEPLPLILPFLACVAIAVIISAFNGFGMAKLHMHPFIVTLGTQLISYGLCCIYIENQPSGSTQALSSLDQRYLALATGSVDIFGFKLPYLVTDRRLAAPQLPGRARKTPRPGRQTKALQPLQHSAAEFFTRLSRHVPPPPA